MRLELFSPGDSVLLLGEGNFSFASNLIKHKLPIFIVATCFERDMTLEHQAESIHFLEENEVPVYLDISAVAIHEHRDIAAHKYSKVVFNFPHIGGTGKKNKNIQEHRDLLREMFKSARQVVKEDGQMIVSLCRGQGGTEADLPYTPYEQSWQIAEMGAHGDFIITAVEPYVKDNFPEYKCHDANLSLKGALVHVFSKCAPLFPEEIDDNIADERLAMETITTSDGGYQSLPTFFNDFYTRNPIDNPKSPAHFFKEMLLKEFRNPDTTLQPIKTVTDDDIPLSVESEKGVPVGGEYEPNLRLRMNPMQILNDAIIAWQEFSEEGIIFFPGMYFSELITKDFQKIPPISVSFLIVGIGAASLSYRYLHNLALHFEKENLGCYLRPKGCKGDKMPHPRETIEKKNKEDDLFRWHLGLEWAYCHKDESAPDTVIATVYSLYYNDTIIDAVIIHPDKLREFFFGTFSWREILSDRVRVKRYKNAPPEIRLRKPGMNPPDFIFEAVLHMGDIPFDKAFKELTYRTLWLAAGHVISQVDKINDDSSNITLVIKYHSDDVPLYRERCHDIHRKIVCKMLAKVLNVCVT